MRLLTLGIAILAVGVCADTAFGCDPGFYVGANGECVKCSGCNYCPDGVEIVSCPQSTDDFSAITGGTVFRQECTAYNASNPITAAANCYQNVYAHVTGGTFLWQCMFDGVSYLRCPDKLWYIADNGYYLSRYMHTSWEDWYREVRACTNAPKHAHYTGPGTPDEPKSGGKTDYNDCPWECDSGYERHGDVCTTLCTAGFTQLKTSSGVTVNVYADKPSTPALNISTSRGTCYVALAAGAANNAINVNYNGATYHTTD